MPQAIPPLPPTDTEEFSAITKGARELWNVLISSQLQEKIFPLKITFLVISLLFAIIAVYFLFRTSFMDWWFLGFLKDFLRAQVSGKKMIKAWEKIKKGVEKDSESQRKLSLLRAFSLLDEALKEMGRGGENLGERLQRLTQADISNLSELLESQQVCYDVIRDPDYRLSKEKAKEVVDAFERAFVDLELL